MPENDARLFHGDCLDILPTLGAGSVALMVIDPPYFKIKDDVWDRQWSDAVKFLAWMDQVLEQVQRVLAGNGSLYIFGWGAMVARLEVLVGERFNVLNRIVWVKHDGTENKGGLWSRADKDTFRAYFPQAEYILFAEQYGADSQARGESGWARQCDQLRGFVFEPLRKYFDDERQRAGATAAAIEAWMSARGYPRYMTTRHTFSRVQWQLPTAEMYERMRRCFHELNGGGEYLRREYEDLRREYEDLRREYEDLRREYEDLRRPFTVTPDVPHTDVWEFETVHAYPGKHPCEKPAEMLEHIIRVSSRPGDVVCDPFMGSGSTGRAARRLERQFVGIDADAHWYVVAAENVRTATVDGLPLFAVENEAAKQAAFDFA